MENYDLDTLKSYLPQYIAEWTEKRKYGKYNCPFCGSGTGANGTPAFGLYEDSTKFKCQSCGVQGTIIDFYLMIHKMSNTQENVSQAIKELSEEFHLVSQTAYTPASHATKASSTPKIKIGEREHIYKNADGSIFGKKVVNKFSDGSKNAVWYLFNPETGSFHQKMGLNGQKAPLYNADTLHDNQDEPVYIVEGERDADTLTNWDAIATTFPNGAGFTQWIPLYNEGLKNREVIILTDNDDSGRKYGNTIARNLLNVAKSVKIIPATAIWDKCPEKGDITDITQAVGEEETQELLISAIQRTNFCTAESLPKNNESPTIQQQEIEYHVVRLSDVKFEKQEFLWNPYLPIGEITVMYAAGGTGKSYATIGIASDITTGRSLPRYGIEQVTVNPEKVLFISAEDNESIILSRMREAGGNPDNCFVLKTPKTRKDLQTDSFLLPQNKDDTVRIQAFAKLLEKVHPRLVVIDPWSVYIGDDKNMNKANDVRGVTNVLTVLAKEYHCAILIVAHVNKMPQTENANNAVSGSTALIDSARSALCIRSFGADSDRRVIIQTKSNYQKKAKSVCYQIINQGEHRTAKFEWDGFSDLTEDDLTKSARTGKSLSDIENDNSDEEGNKETAIEVIKRLSVYGQHINISYDRFREELKNECGEDFLPSKPIKFMNSLVSDLRACGISIELKRVRGILNDGSRDTETKRGFVINSMTDGSLMASAMPKK